MRTRGALAILAASAALAAAGCWREQRTLRGAPAAASRAGHPARMVPLQPGAALPDTTQVGPYEGNAWAISEGQRLYQQYNCLGCHFNGGGGIGPALMDDEWIYGSDPQAIHDTIVEGRPNGMPAWGGHIPDDQVWKIVAYVRSLSGLERKDAIPGRSDHMPENAQAQPR